MNYQITNTNNQNRIASCVIVMLSRAKHLGEGRASENCPLRGSSLHNSKNNSKLIEPELFPLKNILKKTNAFLALGYWCLVLVRDLGFLPKEGNKSEQKFLSSTLVSHRREAMDIYFAGRLAQARRSVDYRAGGHRRAARALAMGADFLVSTGLCPGLYFWAPLLGHGVCPRPERGG